jgi:hypothetical protein
LVETNGKGKARALNNVEPIHCRLLQLTDKMFIKQSNLQPLFPAEKP